MLIKRLRDCEKIEGLDGTIIRELLNPHHDDSGLKLGYSLAHAVLESGKASKPHKFFEASEVYYILSGNGVMHIDDEQAEVEEGDAIYIPPSGVQYIENTGSKKLQFLCIVFPAWTPNAEELVYPQ
ncbi:MAG: cupin domain-containing protein [Promethearchaeia archaeon]